MTIVGRMFGSATKGVLEDDGNWKVVIECSESILEEGKSEWEEEKISFMSFNKSFMEAHRTVLNAYVTWMQEFVYSKGYDSLVLAIRDNKELEIPGGSNSNHN